MAKHRVSISAWIGQHAGAFASSFSRLARHPFSSLLSLSVMAMALALPLALAWSLLQMQQLSAQVQSSRAITVFFQPGVDMVRASAIAAPFKNDATVARMQLKSPSEGLAEFQQSSDLAKAIAVLDENPLPAVMVVEPKGDETALLQRLRALPDVEFVQYDGLWQQRLNAWLALGERLLLAVAGIFVLGAVLAVANNVRLDIATRVREIAVLQQLGASDGYIRRPFLYTGGLLGLLAGVLAVALLLAGLSFIRPSVMALLRSYGSDFQFSAFPLWVLPAIFGMAVILGLCGAWFAVAHHLRQTRPVNL